MTLFLTLALIACVYLLGVEVTRCIGEVIYGVKPQRNSTQSPEDHRTSVVLLAVFWPVTMTWLGLLIIYFMFKPRA